MNDQTDFQDIHLISFVVERLVIMQHVTSLSGSEEIQHKDKFLIKMLYFDNV